MTKQKPPNDPLIYLVLGMFHISDVFPIFPYISDINFPKTMVFQHLTPSILAKVQRFGGCQSDLRQLRLHAGSGVAAALFGVGGRADSWKMLGRLDIDCIELLYIPVGGLEHEFYFSIQLGIIIPTDEVIFFRGVGIPPTSIYMEVFLSHGGTSNSHLNLDNLSVLKPRDLGIPHLSNSHI